jgi:hypothetical protein
MDLDGNRKTQLTRTRRNIQEQIDHGRYVPIIEPD